MKLKFIKKPILLLFLAVFMYSCNDDEVNPDEDQELDIVDEDIPIDGNSVFNMANFIISWDQMFVGSSRWAWNFDHETEDGRVVKSYQNYHVYGEFGAKYFEINHEYNGDGVLISSTRTQSFSDAEDNLEFEYEYDEEGMVEEIRKLNRSQLQGYTKLTYNDDKQLIQKNQFDENGTERRIEKFEYENDRVIRYISESSNDNSLEFSYEYDGNGNMILESLDDTYNGNTSSRTIEYEYDNQDRIIKEFYKSGDYELTDELTYEGNQLIITSYDENGRISSINKFGPGFQEIGYSEFYYDEFDDFKGRIDIELEDDYETKYLYFGGSNPDNVSLYGYANVNRNSNMDKLGEEFYDANDNFLYEYDYENYIWYTASGNEINESEISEEWVLIVGNKLFW